MKTIYRKQLVEERTKINDLTAKLLLRADGDRGGAEILKLSSEDWHVPYPGISQRICELSSLQDDATVCSLLFEPASAMAIHRHRRQETFFVLTGTVKETVSGEILNAPGFKVIDTDVPHGWRSEEGALVTVLWRPALCSDTPENEKDEDC